MNLLRRAQNCFQTGRERAVAALRRAKVVASHETGARIEGSNAYHWVSAARRPWCTTPPRRGPPRSCAR